MRIKEKSPKEIIAIAVRTLEIEARSIDELKDRIGSPFAEIVRNILKSHGKLVITGVGKSAIIAGKIVATLNSTGTPAVFMHAGDAIHGDIGIVEKSDIVVCISKSGNTPEIKILIPLLKTRGNTLISIVGDINSYLAKQSDFVMDSTVSIEACPHNLTPTASTTAQLALGDALAVCLLEARGFSSRDFAKFHPGGVLGKKLYMRVSDLCSNNSAPLVDVNEDIQNVILEITSRRLGATAVLKKGELKGIITDGDLRRMIGKFPDYSRLKAKDIMNSNPKWVEKETMAVDAMHLMEESNITQLLVMNKKKYIGMIHLHDLIKEGII